MAADKWRDSRSSSSDSDSGSEADVGTARDGAGPLPVRPPRRESMAQEHKPLLGQKRKSRAPAAVPLLPPSPPQGLFDGAARSAKRVKAAVIVTPPKRGPFADRVVDRLFHGDNVAVLTREGGILADGVITSPPFNVRCIRGGFVLLLCRCFAVVIGV